MNIYEIVNELLEDKTIDSARVAAICWGPSLGYRVRMDDRTGRRYQRLIIGHWTGIWKR